MKYKINCSLHTIRGINFELDKQDKSIINFIIYKYLI